MSHKYKHVLYLIFSNVPRNNSLCHRILLLLCMGPKQRTLLKGGYSMQQQHFKLQTQVW